MPQPSPIPPPIDSHLRSLIRLAVQEDLGLGPAAGDKTVQLSIPDHPPASAAIVARKTGVVAGRFLIEPILQEYPSGQDVQVQILTPDASPVVPNQKIAVLAGSAQAILSAERVLLNFLSHLSGIATLTRQYVDAVSSINPPPKICDTRKTTPGFRLLDKYAVRCGGGVNHRLGLYDGVMLKDNHLAALRGRLGQNLSLAQLTAQIRSQLDPPITLWLEVDTLDQLRDAISSDRQGADIILLDNFSIDQIRQAVQIRNQYQPGTQNAKHPLLEASGGITLANILAVAQTGVDRISIGALTHSAPILDLSMDFSDQLTNGH